MQTEKLNVRFDCRKYNQKLPREQWQLLADSENITATATFAKNELPKDLMMADANREYVSRSEQESAKNEKREAKADRVAVRFKIGQNCRWFDEQGKRMDRPTNETLDKKQCVALIDFARKDKKADNPLAPCGFWANAIMVQFVEESPFAGKEFVKPDDLADDEQGMANQEEKGERLPF